MPAAAQAASQYVPSTWLSRDARFYANVNATLVEDFTLEQSRFASSWYDMPLGWNRNLDQSWSNMARGRGGELYPKHPVLMPVLATPLYMALGLDGTLLFNLLMFGLIGLGAFAWARGYHGGTLAAVSVAAFVFATDLHAYIYAYRVDVTLLALFCAALAQLPARRTWLAGLLVAAAVTLKPTTLMWVPSLALLAVERRGRLWPAVAAACVVLLGYGALNWEMFGRPWWTAYHRIVVLQGGVAGIIDNTDAFSVPFDTGWTRMWEGRYGLRHHFTLLWVAAPGLALMLRRRPLYVLATVLAVALDLWVFAHYRYEGHRFHWPALMLLVPAFAATAAFVVAALRWIARRLARGWRALGALGARRGLRGGAPSSALWLPRRAPLVAVLLTLAAGAASVQYGPPAAARIGDSAYVLGARSWGEGAFDLSETLTGRARARAVHPMWPLVSRGRDGQWLPRASPPSVAIAAVWSWAGGDTGLWLLHLLAACLVAFAAAWLIEPTVGGALAALSAAGALMLPAVRSVVVTGGPDLLGAAALGMAAVMGAKRHWRAAGALAVLGAWLADAPWMVVMVVLLFAARQSRMALLRASGGGGVVALVWGVVHFWILGRPFASPEDFLLVELGGTLRAYHVMPLVGPVGLTEALFLPGEGHSLWPLALAAVPGVVYLWMRDRWAGTVVAISVACAAVPRIDAAAFGEAPVWSVACIALGCAATAHLFATQVHTWLRQTRRPWLFAVVPVLLLLVVGALRMGAEASAPFRIATEQTTRHAEVHLGPVPCDFLAWEHYSWECSHHDRGVMGLTGLATSEGIDVAGERTPLFLIPTGQRGEARTVTFHGAPASGSLHLTWAIPDGQPGGGELRVLFADQEIGHQSIPSRTDGHVHPWVLELPDISADSADLTFVHTGRGARAVVAVDGTVVP